jgi:acetyl-CoA carboxylase carboxyl transferase subunit alpha
MSYLEVPVISIVIGEGGSGGAIGIGVANKVAMLENAYYSVISPEGCAAILFRDATKSQEATEALKITAKDLLKNGVIDEIIKEPVGGAHVDAVETAMNIKRFINKSLLSLSKMKKQELADDRYKKFRNIGVFEEAEINKKIQKNKTQKNSKNKKNKN